MLSKLALFWTSYWVYMHIFILCDRTQIELVQASVALLESDETFDCVLEMLISVISDKNIISRQKTFYPGLLGILTQGPVATRFRNRVQGTYFNFEN